MSALEIVEWPAKVLETKAEDVVIFDDELRTLVTNMHETVHHHQAIGLAANQVGVLKRVIAIKITYSEREDGDKREWWHDKSFTFINPVITKRSGRCKSVEGCLSFPDIYEWVERSSEVSVTAKNEKGEEFTVEANGLLAICLQHELDHLDGIVFFRRMSRLKANSLVKRVLKRRSRDEGYENEESGHDSSVNSVG